MNSSDILAQKVKGLASSTEKIVSTGKEHQNHIISLQLILFGFQDGKFTVVNYCHNEKHYQSLVNNYFNKAENKSLLNIIRIPEDDTWYSERSDKNKVFLKRPFLEYELYNNVPAKFDSEIIRYPEKKKIQKAFIKSQKYWDNWCDLIFNSIYGKEAFSCFMKKLVIQLDKNNNRYLYTGLTFSFTNRINHTQISLLSNECYEFLNNLSFDYLIPNLYNNLSLTATRAAISQVMARNLSHNIGSHVMNKLTGNLEEFPIYSTESYASYGMEILYKEKFVKERRKGTIENEIADNLKNEILLDQISVFNNYVKCRMDYLSDVTFGTPLMQTNKKVLGELFNDLDKVRMLLNNISGLSDFKYSIKFVRTNYNKDGKPETEDLDAKNDFPVAMPNDLLGCQAFYNIIENVIRNTAKHNQNKIKNENGKEEPTVFTVNIHTHININPEHVLVTAKGKNIDKKEILETLDLLNTMYMVEIYDNLPVNVELEDKNIAEYLNVVDLGKKSENIQPIDWLVYKQNKKINTSILQENNALRTHALGIIEMEASAAYLRKMEITDFDGDEYDVDYKPKNRLTKQLKLPVLKAIEKDGSLGYRFFIHKPQEILLVGDFDISNIKEIKKKLLLDGVWIKTKDDFEKELIAGKVYNHQFVLYKDEDVVHIINKNKTALPIRTLFLDENKLNEINKILEEYRDFEELEGFIWTWWGKEYCKKVDKDKIIFENDRISEEDLGFAKNDNSFISILSDHAEKKSFEDSEKLKKSGEIHFIDVLSSNAQKKLPAFTNNLAVYKKDKIDKSELIQFKLFESCANKILVIDERIQNYANSGSYDGIGIKIPIKNIFNYAGIILPDVELGGSNFTDEIKKQIKSIIEDISKYDFVLIHYSILERILGSDEDKINEFLLDIVQKNPKTNVIITSGRGKPKKLTDKVRFVNLSPVLSNFIDNRSKYNINYLLNSTRK